MFKCNCDTFNGTEYHAAECNANPETLRERFVAHVENLSKEELVSMLQEWIFFAELPECCMKEALKKVMIQAEKAAT